MGKLLLQKPKEVEANLKSLGFVYKRTVGSHKQYDRCADARMERKVVTVDIGKPQFSRDLMKYMIRQSGFTQDEFCSGVASPLPQPQPPTKTPPTPVCSN